ncbi:MAG: MFS transporter [Thermodesulfobacteriota bacterium]
MKILPLFIFWSLWFLNFSTRTIFSPILPLIEDGLSISHGQAGGLFTSLAIGFSITLFLTGRLALDLGYKRMVGVGIFCISLVLIGFHWAESYRALHLLFFLLGFASGTYLPTIFPILTQTYEPQYWGKAIGIHETAPCLSIFFIPVLTPFALRYFHWKSLLLILGIMTLLFLIPFWRVSVEPRHEKTYERSPYLDIFRNRVVWIIGLLWVFSAASSLGVYSILPLYLIKERGMEFGFANRLLGISRVAGVMVPLSIGVLTDRYGFKALLRWSIFSTGLSTIGLALFSQFPSILITLILQALLSLAFFPVAIIAISKLTPISKRSISIGVITSIGVIFGTGGGPFILGMVADHFSFKIGLLGLGVLTTLSSFLTHFIKEA